MAVKIRLRRTGKRNAPAHRIVVADGRSPRDGRFIEILGTYDPRAKAETIDLERAAYWLEQGAQPSETVAAIIKRARAGMPMTPVVQTQTVAAEPAEPAAAEPAEPAAAEPAADETAEETTEEPASEPATPEDSGEESDDDDAKEADA